VLSEYNGSGTGTTGPLNLVKNGPATLTLGGVQTYSGSTTVNAGALQLDGLLGPGAVVVQSGATLTGTGLANGPTIVNAGGTLAPGAAAPGVLRLQNTLTLGGEVVLRLAKSAVGSTADQVLGVTALSYGGELTVTNIGPAPLAAGDSLVCFGASSYTGAFAGLVLPPLAGTCPSTVR
jgi:autotransporter-associated beta strand protein